MSLFKKVIGIVAVLLVYSVASLHAETIGSAVATGGTFPDNGVGKVYIYNGSPKFTTAGTATSFDYFSSVNGRHVVPLLLSMSGTTFTVTGVGDDVTSNGSGAQSGSFSLIAGSSSVSSGYTFGYYSGIVSSDGAGGVTQGTKDSGTIPSAQDGNGPWLFVGDITPTVTLGVGTVFKILDGSQGGGSGTVADPYNLWSSASGNGRTYRMNLTATAVPEPGSLTLIIFGALGLTGDARRKQS